jgi:CheY-like chemotaxis protein/GAF domain-containing protein
MTKILIVEDERIIAEDMQKRLKNMGYDSIIASTGEEAIQKAEGDTQLVLMDIVLGEGIDGIEAAQHIRSQVNIPVVFVTAYTDEKTLKRAKVTEPFGYIVKPFGDKELRATIEMALYKHQMEKALQGERDKLQALMDGLVRTEIGINIVRSDYVVLFQNQTLKNRFGDVTGELCYKVFMGLNQPCTSCPVERAVRTNAVQNQEVVGVCKKYYEIISAPFPSPDGSINKAIEVVIDITERKRSELQLRTLFEASKLINSTMDIDTIFRFIADAYQELVGFDNFVIFLVSEDKTSVYPAYTSERVGGRLKNVTLEYDDGLIGYCIKTKEPLLSGNAQLDERARKISGVTEPFISQIIVPLIIEDECVGAIHISKAEENAYDEGDVEALKPLGEVISSAARNSQLYHEIKEIGEQLEKRIEEKSKKLEIILNTRQSLQKERSWERGLTTIVEAMEMLGFERSAVFLVNPMRKTLESYSGKGGGLPKKNVSISLKDTEYFGVQCVMEKKTIHIKEYEPGKGKQIIPGAHSFVWVPIVVQNEAFAALATDNMKSNSPITEEDVKDLEILAGMCAAFIDRTRILVEPVAEDRLRTAFKYWLDPAEGYVVLEKKPEKCLEIFVDLVTHGIPGFVVSRKHPGKLRREYKLARTPIVWLSRSGREDTMTPDDLPKLNFIIEDFTKKSEESVVLFDGLEYLVSQIGFETVLKFLQELRDVAVVNNSRMIIPLHRDTVSTREFSILEREFTIL